MPEPLSDAVDALSKATSGPNTPDAVNYKRPTTISTWCQAGALLAACVGMWFAFHLLGTLARPGASDNVLLAVIHGVEGMGMACVVCIALSGLSQFYSKVEGSAGSAHIQVEGGRVDAVVAPDAAGGQ